MNFKDIPAKYYPAYTWLWNSTVTREGIKAQIDEMYDNGIRAFYVLGEPENFRPLRRRTHLSPEYLSDEYLDLVYYAYEVAEEKGMYTWLYNEGGFPSGMASGKIRELHPHLAIKLIFKREFELPSGIPYRKGEKTISAFVSGKEIKEGEKFGSSVIVCEYFYDDDNPPGADIRTDIAARENLDCFIKLTHERYKKRFGSILGDKVHLMFDDEAFMGTWSEGFDKIFFEKYGYEIGRYMPFINGDSEPEAEDEYRAKSDYIMLCGDLVRDNYFIPMKEWLNANGMLSTGHIDNDHLANGLISNRYGNSMQTLRAFNVPGIDAIWNQIYYPDENNSFNGMNFFPRFASSAARQQEHSTAMSESLAVYGAHVDAELMRYAVNYQAVRGISLFNFMVISYDRKTAMMHQYRPNFIKENPSMDRLSEINGYTARLSFLLENSRADIKTALYHPARSIAAEGKLGKRAEASFVRCGDRLESLGISFDIIDEELVISSTVEDGRLIYGNTAYENIIIPECDFERTEVIEKIKGITADVAPEIKRKNIYIQARRVVFPDGSEGYFIVNTSAEKITETVTLDTKKNIYEIDLYDGEIYEIAHSRKNTGAALELTLLRGEGIFILATDERIDAKKRDSEEFIAEISDVSSFISRRLTIDTERGTVNDHFEDGELRHGFYAWDKDFSGEVTYLAKLPALKKGKYVLDLGDVSTSARVYIDDLLVGETTMPPYRIKFEAQDYPQNLKIVVANTAANECARTNYFDVTDIRDVGPYHEKMKLLEAKKECGGLFGPLKINKII